MQAILAAIIVPILKWLLETGGRYLYEKVNRIIKEHDDQKTARENLKRYEDAVKAKDDAARKSAAQDMLNGTKRK